MNEMKHHEMPQAIPEEKLDEITGGAFNRHLTATVEFMDKPWLRSCDHYLCQHCGGTRSSHSEACPTNTRNGSKCESCKHLAVYFDGAYYCSYNAKPGR